MEYVPPPPARPSLRPTRNNCPKYQTEDALEYLTLEITGAESAYVPCADRLPLLANPMLAGPDAGRTGEMTCVSEHRQICRGEQTLATLSNAVLEPRTHSWPFKFKIPAGAPPTQKVGCWLICAGFD